MDYGVHPDERLMYIHAVLFGKPGMSEIARSNEGDVSITDGFYKFAIFQVRPALGELKMEIGAHHVGVEVDFPCRGPADRETRPVHRPKRGKPLADLDELTTLATSSVRSLA